MIVSEVIRYEKMVTLLKQHLSEKSIEVIGFAHNKTPEARKSFRGFVQSRKPALFHTTVLFVQPLAG